MLIEDGAMCCYETTTTAPYFKGIDCDCEEE